MSLGVKGEIHGFKCYVLLDEKGEPAPVHSIASGLDYPGVGPQHSHLRDLKLATYESATDAECLEAFMALSRLEGIIPALESAHAIAYAMKILLRICQQMRRFWSICQITRRQGYLIPHFLEQKPEFVEEMSDKYRKYNINRAIKKLSSQVFFITRYFLRLSLL